MSKYNLDLHLFCKYNSIHGELKKIVKCYCPLCDDLFGLFKRKANHHRWK